MYKSVERVLFRYMGQSMAHNRLYSALDQGLPLREVALRSTLRIQRTLDVTRRHESLLPAGRTA